MKIINELENILKITKKENIIQTVSNLKRIIEKHGSKPNIINAGLLKAGKSSLFNALAGKEEFETGVVRTTVSNKNIEMEKYILIDTPGFDANEQDDKTAFEGYKTADLIIFVHNVMEGELNKLEAEQIDKISKLYSSHEDFFEASILVLSFNDQVENGNTENTLSIISKQMEELFNCKFKKCVAISSSLYMKGFNENKNALIKISNLSELQNLINESIENINQNSLFEKYVTKQIKNIHSIMNEELKNLQNELNNSYNGEDIIKKLKNSKIEIEAKIQETIERVDREIPKNYNFSDAYFGANCNSYTEYKSSSAAMRAATEACEAAIKSAAAQTRTTALNAVAYYENFIHPDGKLANVKRILFEGYNEIKEIYYSIASNNKMRDFNINIPNKIQENKIQIECCYDVAKYIEAQTFSSAHTYLTRYDANCYIDEDYRTEYVSGLFGDREKEVKYYTWDIKGAVDDIKDSVRDILEDRVKTAYDTFNKIYTECVDEMLKEFKLLFGEISSSMDKKILEQNMNNNQKTAENQKKIQEINNLEKEIKNLQDNFIN